MFQSNQEKSYQHSANFSDTGSYAQERKTASSSVFRDIQFYMNQIKQTPLLTLEEEKELSYLIHHGHSEKIRRLAREKLIVGNLRLVVKIAFQYSRFCLPIEDLIAEGNAGLLRAVEEYDPRKGAKFSYYASWWIKLAIRRAISNQQEMIRLPQDFAERQRKYFSAYTGFCDRFQREPTDSELAALLGCSVRVIKNIRVQSISTVSLNSPVAPESRKELLLILPDKTENNPDQLLLRQDELNHLKAAMASLNPLEQKILQMRFGFETGFPLTLESVSCHLGKTKERIRQIQNQAIQKLKNQLTKSFAPSPIWQHQSLAG